MKSVGSYVLNLATKVIFLESTVGVKLKTRSINLSYQIAPYSGPYRELVSERDCLLRSLSIFVIKQGIIITMPNKKLEFRRGSKNLTISWNDVILQRLATCFQEVLLKATYVLFC